MKKTLREMLLAKRNAMDESDCIALSRKIMENLFSTKQFLESRNVAFYIHKGNEVHTDEMIRNSGKQVFVPVTGKEMKLSEHSDELAPGKYGIHEPKNPKIIDFDPDIIIVPGIAFGKCMHRIGYGKGYYDDFLKTSGSFKIGICYDFQILEKLPSHHTDVPLDMIVSEKRIINK